MVEEYLSNWYVRRVSLGGVMDSASASQPSSRSLVRDLPSASSQTGADRKSRPGQNLSAEARVRQEY